MNKIFKILIVVILVFITMVSLFACSGADETRLNKMQSELDASNAKITELEALINGQSKTVNDNNDAIINLQTAIGNYASELDEYHNELENAKKLITELESKISSGNTGDLSSINEQLEEINEIIDQLSLTTQKMRTDVTGNGQTLNSLKDKVRDIEDTLNDPSKQGNGYVQVNLADKYYLVVNDNFQLFYRSVIRSADPYQYYIYVSGTAGHTFNRYYEYKPESTGTITLTISVKDDNGNLLGTDSTTLVVASNNTNRIKNVLCIGDSLTANGQWIARGAGKFEIAGGTINTIGTINKDLSSSTLGISKSMTVHYEGRSGWQWSSYLDSYGSVKSPFLINNKLSFKEYITTNNLQTFDEVYILMTFNGFTSTDKYDFDSQFLRDAKALVDQIHSDYPSARITLMGLPLTSTYAGLGRNYSVSGSYSDNYGVHIRIHEYDNFLEEWSKMADYKSFMRYIDIKGQFDSEFNMPYESKQVNNTNTSVKENVGNAMGMHPSSNGYNQIGDAFFRALMSNW